MTENNKGYIALMSALIISAVIILIAITIGQMAYLGRANIAGAHFKEKSRALAESCVYHALLALSGTSTYTGGENISVASDTCNVVSVVTTSTGRVISAQGIFQRSYTNYKVTVTTSAVDIISWEEVKNL